MHLKGQDEKPNSEEIFAPSMTASPNQPQAAADVLSLSIRPASAAQTAPSALSESGQPFQGQPRRRE
eukprot:96320-Chlamydomonas_euryale.AAC.9